MVTFANENSPKWNEYWKNGYDDAYSSDGYLVNKPFNLHPMLWEAYCSGVEFALSERQY